MKKVIILIIILINIISCTPETIKDGCGYYAGGGYSPSIEPTEFFIILVDKKDTTGTTIDYYVTKDNFDKYSKTKYYKYICIDYLNVIGENK